MSTPIREMEQLQVKSIIVKRAYCLLLLQITQTDSLALDGEGNPTCALQDVSQYAIPEPPPCEYDQIFGFHLSKDDMLKFGSQLIKQSSTEAQRQRWKEKGANTDEDKMSYLNAQIAIGWFYQIKTCYLTYAEADSQEGADAHGRVTVLTIHDYDEPLRDAPPPDRVQHMAKLFDREPRWWVDYDSKKEHRAIAEKKRRVAPA
ncbi:hypothetical protein F5I97DRAFT_1925773 [Phlebopus sp. FC_14]|nr:hypothetical protein F5I97DRAFT_1925773 [Phlebopus sp. FC_14]